MTKDSVGAMTTQGLCNQHQTRQTQVTIDNGGTLVIGGIYQEDKPQSGGQSTAARDIPLLGNLFKTTTRSVSKTNC